MIILYYCCFEHGYTARLNKLATWKIQPEYMQLKMYTIVNLEKKRCEYKKKKILIYQEAYL